MSTYIFHMSDFSNLDSILKYSCLLSHNELNEDKIVYTDASYQDIQDRRATKQVPCCVKGVLHDYVPFFFAPKSPMLYVIHNGRITNCPEGQSSIIHFVTKCDIISSYNIPFAFTDGHAIMELSVFYDKLDDLDKIDWEVINSKYWYDTQMDNDRKRRRQAEFLVHKKVPIELIENIVVINNEYKKKVEEVLAIYNVQIPVNVNRNYYY